MFASIKSRSSSILGHLGSKTRSPGQIKRKTCFVHLSLLTMTNPNQLCDVLLFVCSKMAYETSLSSKLPVADGTREV